MVECYDYVHHQFATQESNLTIDTPKLLSSSTLDGYIYQPRQMLNIFLDIVVVVAKKKE